MVQGENPNKELKMHKLIVCAYDYEACDGLKLI